MRKQEGFPFRLNFHARRVSLTSPFPVGSDEAPQISSFMMGFGQPASDEDIWREGQRVFIEHEHSSAVEELAVTFARKHRSAKSVKSS